MTMSTPVLTKTDILIENLTLRNVPYFFHADFESPVPLLSNVELLSGLASHEEARIKLGLIPLLLRHPEIGLDAPQVCATTARYHQTTFQLYYTAAVLLQEVHAEELKSLLGEQPPLPDWFSVALGVKGSTADEKLQSLAEVHARLTELDLNWIGTYRHGARQFLRELQLRQLWNIPFA
jgi:hypothetical protein